jgi:uncharacterized membrane protein YfcA
MTAAILVGLTAAAATAAQTISGFGLSLLLAPVVQLVLPGLAAIRLVNGTAAGVNALLLAPAWRDVDLRRAALIGLPAITAVLVLTPLVSGHSARTISLVAGAATLVAVLLALPSRPIRMLGSRGGGVVAGVLSGALTVSSGAGGAPIAAHVATRPWSPRRLVATVQLVFLPVNLLATFTVSTAVPLRLVVASAIGCVVGLAAGSVLRPRVPAGVVRQLVLAVAAAGSILVISRAL